MTDRFLLFWAIFCPLTLLTTQKIIILKKWKKTPGDTITLHLCITNDDHIMYGSWDIEHDRHNFLLFYNIFYPFTSLVTWNIKILKKWKISQDIIVLLMSIINDIHMMYGSWNMTQNGQNFLSFWIIFCPCNPLTTQKIKILKKWKKMPGDIIILQMCTINDNCMIYGSWDKESNGQNFLLFWTTFCLFNPLKTRKIKIS